MRGCGCDPCSVIRSKCGRCNAIVPKYKCVSGTYTPDYESSTVCPVKFCWRMFWNCETLRYEVVEIPRQRYMPVPAVTLEVYEPEGSPDICGWLVSTPSGDTAFDCDAAISITWSDGGTWEASIGGAGTVANPLAYCCNSKCKCATCLPSELCASLAFPFCVSGGAASGPLAWNGNGWDGSFDGFDVSVTLNECSESCGASVDILGPDGESGSGEWLFDSEMSTSCEGDAVPRSFVCDESGVITNRNGSTAGCSATRELATFTSQSITLYDGYGAAVGTMLLEDNPCGCECGQLAIDGCPGGCPELTLPSISCPPPEVTITLYSDSCEYSLTGYLSPDGFPDGGFWQFPPNHDPGITYCQLYGTWQGKIGEDDVKLALIYDLDRSCSDGAVHPEKYVFYWWIGRNCSADPVYPSQVSGLAYAEAESTCSPLQIDFDLGVAWSVFDSGAPHCAYRPMPCDNPDESIRVRVTR